MEYLDIVNENGLPTGEIVSRDAAHREGLRHRTAHVWVVRKSDVGYDILLQKRSMEKESFPGLSIAAVQSSYDSEEDVQRIVEDSLRSIPGINGIFVVSSGQTGLRDAFSFLHLDRRPAVVIYDQTPKNEKLLMDDLADFLIDQSGFEQGYRPLHILANAIGRGILPATQEEHTDISIRTKYNL